MDLLQSKNVLENIFCSALIKPFFFQAQKHQGSFSGYTLYDSSDWYKLEMCHLRSALIEITRLHNTEHNLYNEQSMLWT